MIRACSTALLAASLVMIAGRISAYAEPEAPFGLTWGASVDDVRALGAELKEAPKNLNFGVSYTVSKLPKVLSDQETTILSFGFNSRLWRIAAVSKQFANNPHGGSVRNRYEELVDTLSEKYGKPTHFHKLGGSIYSQAEYFLAGISGGHSTWFSHFDTKELYVEISIHATDSSTSHWVVIFENKPLKKTFDSERKGKEKGAL